MTNCEGCKWWDDHEYRFQRAGKNDYGECRGIHVTQCPPNLRQRACIGQWTGHFAALVTRKDFGCIEFEEKEEHED